MIGPVVKLLERVDMPERMDEREGLRLPGWMSDAAPPGVVVEAIGESQLVIDTHLP